MKTAISRPASFIIGEEGIVRDKITSESGINEF